MIPMPDVAAATACLEFETAFIYATTLRLKNSGAIMRRL